MKQVCDELEITLEEIVMAITQLSAGMKVLASTRIKPDLLVVLVARASNVRQGDVEKVLEALPQMEAKFLKKK